MTAAMLIDHGCVRPGCDAQTVWPARAAQLGWFVITDRYGRVHVWCPEHGPHEKEETHR